MAKVIERVTQIAVAIDEAAAAGIHHGDLRPSDIVFDGDATCVSRVGLAQALLTVGIPVDTIVSYSSPQRLAGAQPTSSDDVYSLAAIALELVIGRNADTGGGALSSFQTESRVRPAPHETRLFTRLRGIDAGLLRASFAAALSEKAEERPATAAEFVGRFRKAFVARNEPVAAPREHRTVDRVAAREATESLVLPPAPRARHIVADLPDDAPAGSGLRAQGSGFNVGVDERRDELPLHDGHRGRPLQSAPYAPSVRWIPEVPDAEPLRRGLRIALAVGVVGLVATLVIGFGLGLRSEETAPEPVDVGDVAPIDDPQPEPTLAPAAVPTGDPAPGSSLAATPPPAEPGRILVRSTPEGADVRIDGEAKGVTPLALRDVALGDHTVDVSYPGLISRQQQVTLSAERPSQSIELMLTSVPTSTRTSAPQSGFGVLHVDSRPARAQVFLDDTLMGDTPLVLPNVSAGEHRVQIRLPGYRSWSTSVQIEPSTKFRVAASLER